MKKGVLVVFVMLLGVGVVAGSGWAERAGGSCTVAAPYGGDYFSLDPHITTRTQDYLVTEERGGAERQLHRPVFWGEA